MNLTDEQNEIIRFISKERASLLVNAGPGAAKTSTLVLAAHANVVPTLSLAFNKRIATELQFRMPGHVMCKTINGLGHGVLMKMLGKKRLMLDTSKTYSFVKDEVEKLKGDDRREAQGAFKDIMKSVSSAKANGYIPSGFANVAQTLISFEDFLEILDTEEELSEQSLGIVERVLDRSIKAAFDGLIDFDDQIYIPTMFNGPFPKFALVMGDEIQDFSSLNHEMLRKLRPERFAGVGDKFQSIYAFRGADQNSMSVLRDMFKCEERTLSVSFRCPITGVKRAQSRNPILKWFSEAIEGEIIQLEEWSSVNVPDACAILCRNNAPLFACAIRLIRAGRGVHIVGRDIGPGLIKVLAKLGPPDMTRDSVLVAIDAWAQSAQAKAKEAKRASIADRAECLKVFADAGETLADAISYAEHLFASEGAIQLMSGHKAKGLEFDEIIHLDPWRIPSAYALTKEEKEQEMNLKYVIETRWKKRMFLANLEKMK